MLKEVCYLVMASLVSGAGIGATELPADRTEAAELPIIFGLTTKNAPGASPLNFGSPAFDPENTPYVRSGNTIHTLQDGNWIERDLGAAAALAINRDIFNGEQRWDGRWDNSAMVDTGIVFDARGNAYTIIVPRYSNLKKAVLLYSQDRAESWRAYALSAVNATLEKPDGFNDLSGPPAILSFENYGSLSGKRLWLEVPEWHLDGLELASNLVAENSLLYGNHSGAANSAFSVAGKIFVVYPVTDNGKQGSAAFIRQYDRGSRKFDGDTVFLGRSTTLAPNDPHDIPAITGDAQAYLHVILGSHHGMFRYMVASCRASVLCDWSAPVDIGEPKVGRLYGSYTYLGINMSRDQTLNIFARSEGYRYKFELVQMRKRFKQPLEVWSNRINHRVIASPDRSYYAAWRQRVSTDRLGNIYLHFRYWPNQLSDEEVQQVSIVDPTKKQCRGGRCIYIGVENIAPTTLISRDDGLTWSQP